MTDSLCHVTSYFSLLREILKDIKVDFAEVKERPGMANETTFFNIHITNTYFEWLERV